MKPHKHAEFIKTKADGSEIQKRGPDSLEWFDMGCNDWNFDAFCEFRIKPPAPKWPLSTLNSDYIRKEWNSFEGEPVAAFAHVANLALSHALETGQVVLPDAKAMGEFGMKVAHATLKQFSYEMTDNAARRIVAGCLK